MRYRLSLAAVVAAALFAVAWVLCDQLAGLGADGSSAAAGVLAIVVFGLTARVTRPERPRVQHLRSAHAKPDGLGRQIGAQPRDVLARPAARSGARRGELPERPGVTARSTPHAGDMHVRDGTVLTQDIQFIVDDAGMPVQGKRKTPAGGCLGGTCPDTLVRGDEPGIFYWQSRFCRRSVRMGCGREASLCGRLASPSIICSGLNWAN